MPGCCRPPGSLRARPDSAHCAVPGERWWCGHRRACRPLRSSVAGCAAAHPARCRPPSCGNPRRRPRSAIQRIAAVLATRSACRAGHRIHPAAEVGAEHWPVPKSVLKTPQGKLAFTEQRDRFKHILGNLTLVAGSLNPALSRSLWKVKKVELLRCSQPGLSRELHEVEAGRSRRFWPGARCWWRWLVRCGGIRWGREVS